MMYFTISSCNQIGPVIIGQVFLADNALQIGWFIQTVENPGICFSVIAESPVDPGETPFTMIGPAFSSCAECVAGILLGCTDPTSCNYNPCATIDDGSCTYNNATIVILCNDPITPCN